MSSIVNHVGLAVRDLDRSRRFYENVLGFAFKSEMAVPDAATGKLFGMEGKLGVNVVYLTCGDWVLELIAYADAGVTPVRDRPMNEPGLTHISICVEDPSATLAAAIAFGGEVLSDRGFPGMVDMIRDPDGQLIEVMPMGYRDTV